MNLKSLWSDYRVNNLLTGETLTVNAPSAENALLDVVFSRMTSEEIGLLRLKYLKTGIQFNVWFVQRKHV